MPLSCDCIPPSGVCPDCEGKGYIWDSYPPGQRLRCQCNGTGRWPNPPSANTPQPPSLHTSEIPTWELVIADMKERDQTGRQKYGTPLQPSNGRDSLVDAYQEALDLVVYLRNEIEKQKLTARELSCEELDTLEKTFIQAFDTSGAVSPGMKVRHGVLAALEFLGIDPPRLRKRG